VGWERSELTHLITDDSRWLFADLSNVMPETPSARETRMAAKFEISKDHAGKFRFHLKAPNGEIIAASQGYETKANAEKGIEAIKTHAPSAKVEDHSA
jgi:uncharacterized protein YegP (UPF0339 family)